MRRKNEPGDVALFLGLLDQTIGRRQQKRKNMRPIYIRRPGETEDEARQRLAAERGDFLTPTERAEDRQDAVLKELRQESNNPNL